MKNFTIDQVPDEVQMVWVIKGCGQLVGSKMFEKIQQIIKKYPEWFPETNKYEVYNP